MLTLKKINKSYKTGAFIQHALKGINLEFRENEFVAILGASGSGKTTLLNIIGGLDRYDAGDLIINGKSTKLFKNKDWDSYRNNCIGFIFQSYNLISHISVLNNVEMGMTLSGISKRQRRKKAIEVLEKVGLKEHIHKKPNQLSGGQMQRVAIARALANDPDVILADEPTGALDSETSIQIMDLIKEIAKDKLVIMVTHNPELANNYATRIVKLKDGELIDDSNPVKEKEQHTDFHIRKTAMSFLTALKLSFTNIMTKKGRTLLTALASGIGIIGIALVLALSNGFNIEVDKFEQEALSNLPIIISEQSMQLDEETMLKMQLEMQVDNKKEYPKDQYIYPHKNMQEQLLHKNVITQEFIDYVEKISPDDVSGISYTRATAINALVKLENGVSIFKSDYLTVLPKSLDDNQNDVLEDNYDVLKGQMPTNQNEIVIAIDSKNRLDEEMLKAFGIDTSKEKISFDDLLGKQIKVVFNNDWYRQMGEYFTLNTDFQQLYDNENNITLTIVGIIRGKEDKQLLRTNTFIGYTEQLVTTLVNKNSQSDIVKLQQVKDYNVLTGDVFSNTDEGKQNKEMILSYLGADSVPMYISIYPRDFDSKDNLLSYLDKYNEGKTDEEKIVYNDMADLLSSLSGSIMDAITIVLIAFSSISLVVSSIMIGIITYISVLERTKEIGVLRALGARKKDITRVFNAETVIIGLCSGLLGLIIAQLLIVPINSLIENLSGLANVAKMNPLHAITLLLISMLLTVIGGFIPAKMASKKDPVEALRTE